MVEDDGKGPVEKGAHFYRSLQIDATATGSTNAMHGDTLRRLRTVDSPGAADTVHFRMKVPKNQGQNYSDGAPLLSQIRLV